MPFLLIIVGLSLLVSGVRNTQDDLYTLVKGDFTGRNNFIYWSASILVIGAVGYIDKLKPVSNSFLTLLVIVLLLSDDKGVKFFQGLTATLETTNGAPPPSTASPTAGFDIGNFSQLLKF